MVSPNGLPIVCVDRSTQWGNPYKVGELIQGKPITQQVAVELFRQAVLIGHPILKFRRGDLWKLRGKNLACWCGLAETCHADILLNLANERKEP